MSDVNKSLLLIFSIAGAGGLAVLFMAYYDQRDEWLDFVVKVVACFAVMVVLLMTLTGCTTSYPAVSHPRALGIGNMQPHCLFFCFQTNTQTDAESGATQTSTNTTTQSADVSVGVTP